MTELRVTPWTLELAPSEAALRRLLAKDGLSAYNGIRLTVRDRKSKTDALIGASVLFFWIADFSPRACYALPESQPRSSMALTTREMATM